jgi:hypothetical protein
MKFNRLVLALPLLLLGACMGGPQALREDPAGIHSFEAVGAVAQVALRIHAQAAKCYSGGTYMPSGVQTSQTRAGLQIDHDAATAVIDVTLFGALGPQTWLLMDMREASPGRTRVDVRYSRSGYERRAVAVERWLREGYEKCR